MELSHRVEENIYLILMRGNLVEGEASDILTYAKSAFEDDEIKGMVMNFQEIVRFDSSGIGVIVSVFKRLQQLQKKLVLCQLNQKLTEQLTRIRLNKLISIYSTESEALASFRS